MEKANNTATDDEILEMLKRFPDRASIDEIRLAYNPAIHSYPAKTTGEIIRPRTYHYSRNVRTTAYHLANNQTGAPADTAAIIPLTSESVRIRANVTAPIQHRNPVGYHRNFLESYRPNMDGYLIKEEMSRLAAIGDTKINQPAGTYAQQILNRLLTRNSSRLEGNTYSYWIRRLIDRGRRMIQKSQRSPNDP